jgi:hypothetical protein
MEITPEDIRHIEKGTFQIKALFTDAGMAKWLKLPPEN